MKGLKGLRRVKSQGKVVGRPKGSKDSKKCKKSGYILREAKKKQEIDAENGVNKDISEYL